MFDKELDVSQIMKEIKQSVIPSEEWSIYEEGEHNGKFKELKVKIEYLHSQIADMKEHATPYLETGYFVPTFERFPGVIRKILRFTAKIVNRLTRAITREQNWVNHDLQNSIDALLQCQVYIEQELEGIHEQLKRLVDSQKEDGEY